MIRQNLLMVDGSKYRALASACAIVATISAFGRWQLDAFSHRPPPKPPIPTTLGSVKQVEPPKLPAPTFLRFTTTPMSIEGALDITDDGSLLTVTTKPDSTDRPYRYTPAKGPSLDLPTKDPTVRYSLSQRGRLIKFQTTKLPFNLPRRIGARLGLYDFVMKNSWIIAPNRRFLASSEMIGYEFGDNNRTFLRIFRDGKAIRTIFDTTQQVGLMEVDDTESIWIWELQRYQRTGDYKLFKGDRLQTVQIDLPNIKATPKLLTSTKGRTILTLNAIEPAQHDVSFERKDGTWIQLQPPPGFKSMIVQKITEDGLMFGAAQSHESNFVPVVWKDGVAYDLRRHPSWPVGGDRSFVQNVNRRGDLVVSTIGGDADETCTLLRRSTSK